MSDAPRTATPDHPVNPDIDLTSGAFWGRNPHDELTWMRHNAPVYYDGRVWGIAKHADVKHVSLNPGLFCSSGGIRPDADPLAMMIDKDGVEHTERRKLVNRGFTPRRLAASVLRINAICDRIIDDVCERGECDAVMDLAAWLPMHVIGDMLGFPDSERGLLLQWSDDMLCALVGAADPAKLIPAADAYQGFRAFAMQAIEDRRVNPGSDLVSLLIADDGDGDEPNIEDVIHDSLLILIGGDETTRHVISGGLYQLLRHPDQRQRLIDDPSLIPAAVEEMLRWVTPIKNMARTVVSDTTLQGQRLAAGDKLLLLYPSANRDEEIFDDPFRFDIGRVPNEHLAFGLGKHFCLGNNLARLELVCFFETVLRRLPDLELVDDAEPAYRPANFVSGYEHLPVRFAPKRP